MEDGRVRVGRRKGESGKTEGGEWKTEGESGNTEWREWEDGRGRLRIQKGRVRRRKGENGKTDDWGMSQGIYV